MADLNSKLSKFNKQHEKVQQTLADVATKRSSSKKPPAAAASPAPAAAPAAALPPAQSISTLTFANDKEKLQTIAQVRSSPTMSQVKRVLELLLETREALLPEQINNSCYVDVTHNKEVFDALRNNVKVAFDGKRFSYKAKHDLKNKQELLVHLRKCIEGISLADLKDAYPGIVNDVQELKANGDIRSMCNSDSQEEILYPDDPRVKIKVDDDIRSLCRSIELPTDFILVERELQKIGVRPMTNSEQRRDRLNAPSLRQGDKQKKKKKMSKRTKYTNIHLPELFQNLPADM